MVAGILRLATQVPKLAKRVKLISKDGGKSSGLDFDRNIFSDTEVYKNKMRGQINTTAAGGSSGRYDPNFVKIKKSYKEKPKLIIFRYSKGLFNYGSHFIDFVIDWYGKIVKVKSIDINNKKIIKKKDPQLSFSMITKNNIKMCWEVLRGGAGGGGTRKSLKHIDFVVLVLLVFQRFCIFS